MYDKYQDTISNKFLERENLKRTRKTKKVNLGIGKKH